MVNKDLTALSSINGINNSTGSCNAKICFGSIIKFPNSPVRFSLKASAQPAPVRLENLRKESIKHKHVSYYLPICHIIFVTFFTFILIST